MSEGDRGRCVSPTKRMSINAVAWRDAMSRVHDRTTTAIERFRSLRETNEITTCLAVCVLHIPGGLLHHAGCHDLVCPPCWCISVLQAGATRGGGGRRRKGERGGLGRGNRSGEKRGERCRRIRAWALGGK